MSSLDVSDGQTTSRAAALAISAALFFTLSQGCGRTQDPSTAKPSSSPEPSPFQAPVVISTPTKTSNFELRLTQAHRAPVEISLSGPDNQRRTLKRGDPLLQTFKLEHGEWELLVRAEGCRNFKVPIVIPESESVTISLMPIPQYWEKKDAAEKGRAEQARALKAKRARKQAELERKREAAARSAAEEENRKRSQTKTQAASATSGNPSSIEFESAILQTKAMVVEQLAQMEWPVGSNPLEVLVLMAERLGEDGTSSEFENCMEHLRDVSTSDDEEMVKLIYITRDIVRKTSPDQVTLLQVAEGFCKAVPSRAKDGSKFDLRDVAATVIFGMAYFNQ